MNEQDPVAASDGEPGAVSGAAADPDAGAADDAEHAPPPPFPVAGRTLRIGGAVVWVVLAIACVAVFGFSLEALIDCAGCAVLVAVTVTDLERRIIPNRIVLPALAVALVVQTARDPSVEWILSAVLAGGFYLLMALVYPAGLGMGDVKLAAFMGAWLGWPVLVALFAASLIAVVPAVAIIAMRGSKGRKVGLPFAPFLAAGAVVALFAGDAVMDAWLG